MGPLDAIHSSSDVAQAPMKRRKIDFSELSREKDFEEDMPGKQISGGQEKRKVESVGQREASSSSSTTWNIGSLLVSGNDSYVESPTGRQGGD